MIKKKKKKHYKIVLLAKTKLNIIESLNSRNLIDSHIIHDEFVLVNNVLSIYDDMKEEIKNLKNSTVNVKLQSIYKKVLSLCLKCRKKIESKNPKFLKKKKKNTVLIKMQCA